MYVVREDAEKVKSSARSASRTKLAITISRQLPTKSSQHAPKRSMTADRNCELTPTAKGLYFASFFAARSEAATPTVVADDGCMCG